MMKMRGSNKATPIYINNDEKDFYFCCSRNDDCIGWMRSEDR